MTFKQNLTGAARGGLLGLALLLAPATAALAQPAPAATCAALQPASLQADSAVLSAALVDIQKTRYAGVRKHRKALEAALAHAPTDAAGVSACGASAADWARTPYPMTALFLGSLAVEDHKYDRATVVLLQGLLLTPSDTALASEAANAMVLLHRNAEALAVVERALAAGDALDPRDRARLLRAKGFSLGEMNRFDDAEAAYRESLRFEPGNATAANELTYIQQRRAGAPSVEANPVNSLTGEPSKPGG